jgi:protein-tyrosine phosphatase
LVVSLLVSDEVRELDLEEENERCRDQGIRFRSFPIPDRGVPESREATRALVTELSRAVADGETVVIHCRQGIGRSALVAASVLVALGIDPQHALDSVAEARGRPVLDTPEQRAWVGGDS